jgi:hypothetical protein
MKTLGHSRQKGRKDRGAKAGARRSWTRAAAGLAPLLAVAAAIWAVSASSSAVAGASLVGEWQRVTTCEDLVRTLTRAGFPEAALEAAAGNGFIPGVFTVEDLADPAHPCKGAIPRRHSHFFTPDGLFGSRDWDGNQVDDGTYEIVDDDALVIPYGFEEGPPIQVTFHFRITGETIRLDPVMPSDCSTSRCREAAAWSVSVALPRKTWRRVG